MTRIGPHSPLYARLRASRRRLRSLQAAIAAAGVLAAVWAGVGWDRPPAGNATVERVIDGDTLVLDDGRHVRLIGVDTPERGDCAYREATDALTRLAGPGASVRLELGEDPTDRYGRTLGYLTVDGRDVSVELARQGWAATMTIRPNTANERQVREAVHSAQADWIGQWAMCSWESAS